MVCMFIVGVGIMEFVEEIIENVKCENMCKKLTTTYSKPICFKSLKVWYSRARIDEGAQI